MRATFCFQASFSALLLLSSCRASGVRDTPLARLSEIGAEDEIDWQFFSRFKGGAWRVHDARSKTLYRLGLHRPLSKAKITNKPKAGSE